MLNGNIIEINLSNLSKNAKHIVDNYDYKYYIAVVKANAYGCGYTHTIRTLENAGFNYFAVSNINEALNVRKYTNKGILMLNPVFYDNVNACKENDVSLMVDDIDYLKDIKSPSGLKMHIKVNTGMNRFGISSSNELENILEYAKKLGIKVEGIYTHLHNASNRQTVLKQMKVFRKLIENYRDNFEMIHVMNSEGLLLYDKFDYTNGIRIGDLLYGFTYDNNYSSTISLKSNISKIRLLKKGEKLGYDESYAAKNDELIAVIPIGYSDGILKYNTGRTVFINNKEYPIVGKICMCCLFVKIDSSVKITDDVYIIKDSRHVMDISNYVSQNYYETAPSEVTTILNKKLKKNYIN